MKVCLLVDLKGLRVWHRWLAEAFMCAGHDLTVLHPGDETRSCPPGLQLALWLDPLWYRIGGRVDHAFDAIPNDELPNLSIESAARECGLDLLIDLSAAASPRPRAKQIVSVRFNGVQSELGAIGAVLGAGTVLFEMDDGEAFYECGRPAVNRRECLTLALDILFSSVVELLVERFGKAPAFRPGNTIKSRGAVAMPIAARSAASTEAGTASGGWHVAKLVGAKLEQYLRLRSRVPRRWAIATRTCTGAGLMEGWPAVATYDVVPDDGRRYYADPFLFHYGGQTTIFCEEYSYATKRGLISAAPVGSDGVVGAFRPVLERPYHLSYPFVFAYEDQVWMMPEASENGSVELYRCLKFPHRWTLDRVLIEGVPGCDPTIFHHNGMYWMILSATRWLGSTSDKQRLYCAPSPLGPWVEHATGLIKMDSTTARPAGAALMHRGRLLRPTQNCDRSYGGSMTLVEMREVSRMSFHEEPVASITPVSPSSVLGTHTYSRYRTIEAVDIWGPFSNIRSAQLQCKPITTVGPNAGRTRLAAVSPS